MVVMEVEVGCQKVVVNHLVPVADLQSSGVINQTAHLNFGLQHVIEDCR